MNRAISFILPLILFASLQVQDRYSWRNKRNGKKGSRGLTGLHRKNIWCQASEDPRSISGEILTNEPIINIP
jgi:hypothetical protein